MSDDKKKDIHVYCPMCREVTPHLWLYGTRYKCIFCGSYTEHVTSRADMEAKIKRLESENKELISDRDYRLVAENARLRSELDKAVELLTLHTRFWSGAEGMLCVLCEAVLPKHAKDCEIAAFLQSQKGEGHE
jgi:hypothetical protein